MPGYLGSRLKFLPSSSRSDRDGTIYYLTTMKNVSRIFLGVTITIGVLLATPLLVLAKDYGLGKTVEAINQGNANVLPSTIAGASTVPGLVGALVSAVLAFLGIIFFFLFFWAGILWMTARGKEESIEQAKGIMEAAVIGLIIVLGSYAITNFVFQQLQKGSTGTATSASPGSSLIDQAAKDAQDAQAAKDAAAAKLSQLCASQTTQSDCVGYPDCSWSPVSASCFLTP